MAAALLWTEQARGLPEGGVDLHAHLSMKPALGGLFRGSIDAPLQADSWDDRLSSKLNAEALDASGLSVVVVALFAHAVFGADMRAQVREQIDEVEAFARAHPRWAIARDAAQARAWLEAGRRVLVLSLEGASGVLESEEDLAELVDERGIRIVTPLHLVGDRYGGVATLGGLSYLGNPLGVAARLLDAKGEIERDGRGLTALGRQLIAKLLARGVWIDLAHASDAVLTELVPMVRAAGQPLLITHTMLRRHRPIERATSDELLRAVADSGGVVGLMPSEDAFDSPQGKRCPRGCAAGACTRGVNAFAAVWADAVRLLGDGAVMLGSDYNGGLRHLAQSCGTATSLDQPAGLWNMGQSAALLEVLGRWGVRRAPLRANLERLLSAWGRVRPQPQAKGVQPLPSRSTVMGPSWAVETIAGAAGSTHDFGLLAGADLRSRKDSGIAVDAEPLVYLTHLRVEATMTGQDEDPRYLVFSLAPAGIVAAGGGDLVEGEILPMSMRRQPALDMELAARIELLRARVRTTPAALEVPGVHALYTELAVDLFGYQMWRHLSGRDNLHGVVLAGVSVQLGSVWGAQEGLSLALYGGGGADLTVLPNLRGGQVGYLSQMIVLAGVRAAQQGGRFFQGLEAQLLAVRENDAAPRWLSTPHYRGFAGFSF